MCCSLADLPLDSHPSSLALRWNGGACPLRSSLYGLLRSKALVGVEEEPEWNLGALMSQQWGSRMDGEGDVVEEWRPDGEPGNRWWCMSAYHQ